MSSSPRFTRGTSVIAALVFAAVLGAVALSLNALQSNSANTAALPAATAPAATAIAQSDATCTDGMDFNYTVSSQTETSLTGNPADYSAFTPTTQQVLQQASKPTSVQTCPSDDQALVLAESPKYGAYKNPSGQWTNLPKQFVVNPGQDGAATTRAGLACSNNQPTQVAATQGLCTYVLSGTSYTLQNWKCRVTLSDTSGALCWVKDVPVQSNVDASTPTASQTPSNSTVSPPGAAVSPDTANTSSALQNCTGNSLSGSYTCAGITPQQAQAALQPIGNYTCSNTEGGDAGVYVACSLTTTSNSDGIITTQDCAGSAAQGGFSCSDVTPQQAQTELQQATGANYSCAPTPNDPTTVSCTPPSTTNPPPPGSCTGANCTPGGTPGGNTGGGNSGGGSGSGNSSGLGALSSLLTGLAKGLLSPCTQTSSVGGNGTVLVPVQTLNPLTGQVTTSYVQQSTAGTSQPCAQQQQAPYGVGSNGAACTAPPTPPQCAAGATAQPTSSQGNGCTDGYQCVPTSSTLGQTPTPQISCSPQTADVGESVAISYSCQNATGSSATGFSTNNQLSGSATTTITAPPSGTNTASFGLTCTNNGQVASTQCSVQVVQPAIDLVADPQFVQSGETASIGWITAGMQSCIVSSPQDSNFTQENASNTSVNGVAQTDAITGSTEFDLTCQTLGGETTEASTVVSNGTGTSTPSTSTGSVSVSSTADGQTVNHGDTVTITWDASTTVSNPAVALWLVDINTEQATALIAGDQSLSGSYSWQLPNVGDACDQNSSYAPCPGNLVDGDSYGIEAAIYTPQDAYLGPPAAAPSGSVSPTYDDYGYTTNTFTIGQ